MPINLSRQLPPQGLPFVAAPDYKMSPIWYNYFYTFISAVGGSLLAVNNLSDVQNTVTSLANIGGSPLAGSTSLTTLGTVTTGTWTATPITTAYTIAQVINVSGTANQITVNGTLNPIVSIANTYLGQTSITTVGTLTTGVVPTSLLSGTIATITLTGTLAAAQFPALTGSVTTSAGSLATTVVTNANLTGGVTSVGNAATVITNANLTGPITSVGNATTISAGVVTEAMQVLADNTTQNCSTAAHGYLKKLSNTATEYMNGTGAWSTPPDTKFCIQRVGSQTGAVASGTGLIPIDDTIPQNTEGDQYLSVSITPTNTASKLIITVVMMLACSAVNEHVGTALFQDSTANALAASNIFHVQNGVMYTHTLIHTMTAGTTSSTTFNVRAGGNSAGTTTFNGIGGTRFYGGVLASSISIVEYAS